MQSHNAIAAVDIEETQSMLMKTGSSRISKDSLIYQQL